MKKIILVAATLVFPMTANAGDTTCNELVESKGTDSAKVIASAISDMGFMDSANFARKFSSMSDKQKSVLIGETTLRCAATKGDASLAAVLKSTM